MTKRKDERRELLKEDEILSFLERSAQYIAQNKQRVAIVSVAVLVALIAIFGMRGYLRQQAYDQAGKLYQVEQILNVPLNDTKSEFKFENETQRYEAAQSSLEEALPSLKGTARIQGLIYRVEIMTMLGQTDDLESTFQEIADSGNALSFVGVLGLGDYYRANEKYDEALKQYNRFLSLPRAPEMDVLGRYKIALCHQASGKLDEARRVLEELKATYDDAEPGDKPPMMTDVDTLFEELNAGETLDTENAEG